MKTINRALLALCAVSALVLAGCEDKNTKEYKKLGNQAIALQEQYFKVAHKGFDKQSEKELEEFKKKSAEEQAKQLEKMRCELDSCRAKLNEMREEANK